MAQEKEIYFAPIEIRDKADLENYGISWNDCKTLHFGKSERITVYYFPTTNKALADMQWAEINTKHSKEYRACRCLVPGKKKPLVVCPDKNLCSVCPYYREMEDRQARIISWDGLIETGYEPESENKAQAALEAWMEFEEVKRLMDEKNPAIAGAVVMKEMYGFTVPEIAKKLGVSQRRVYYLIAQAKTIEKEYARKNENGQL